MKIWGMSYGLIGDLIMGLPMLTYFEKKYPGSYKYWVIEKKCSITAPIFLNHPLIDRIKITDEWSCIGEVDRNLRSDCDIRTTHGDWKHLSPTWYNDVSCVEETARIAGVDDITDVLTEDELKPSLCRWFDVGLPDSVSTYSRTHDSDLSEFDNNIALWPFATGEFSDKHSQLRSPSQNWWGMLIAKLADAGYSVYHYGRHSEPSLSESANYKRFTHLSFFQQVKAAMAAKLVMGPDTGSMWVMGAYSHPAINLITNHMPNHTSNLLALAPVNDNAVNLFGDGCRCDNINTDDVMQKIKEKI